MQKTFYFLLDLIISLNFKLTENSDVIDDYIKCIFLIYFTFLTVGFSKCTVIRVLAKCSVILIENVFKPIYSLYFIFLACAGICVGNTDSRHFKDLTSSIYRFAPVWFKQGDAQR